MPLFEYQGRDAQGSSKSGKVEADSAEEVANTLIAQGVIPTKIAETSTTDTDVLELLKAKLFDKKVATEDILMFSRQMYTLIKAGIPLLNALTRLAENAEHPTLKKGLLGVIEQINAGRTLANAASHYPNIFPSMLVNLIDVGENSGRLEEAFLRISAYLELEETTARQIKSATRYPLFVILAISIAMVIINLFVIPAFADVFAQSGAELPVPTKILLAVSEFFVAYWHIVLIATIGGLLSFRSFISTQAGLKAWHRYLLSAPLIGTILTRIILARFAQALAMVLRAGVQLTNGIVLSAHSVGNAYARDVILSMKDDISSGRTLTQSALKSKLFSPLIIQMISVGEESGSIEHMLEEIAGFYEREAEYALSRLSQAIEPILLTAVGIMVMILALGVFLPMWNMVSL